MALERDNGVSGERSSGVGNCGEEKEEAALWAGGVEASSSVISETGRGLDVVTWEEKEGRVGSSCAV